MITKTITTRRMAARLFQLNSLPSSSPSIFLTLTFASMVCYKRVYEIVYDNVVHITYILLNTTIKITKPISMKRAINTA